MAGQLTTTLNPSAETPREPVPSVPLNDKEPSYVLLREMMESTTDIVFAKDLEGRFTLMNSRGAANLGLKPSDMIGKTVHDFFDADTARLAILSDLEVLREGKTKTFNIGFPVMGERRQFLATLGVCHGSDGRIMGSFGILRDITEIERANQALARERNLLRTVVDAMPDPIFVKDDKCRMVLNNAAHLRLLRVKSQEEAIGKTDADFFPPELADGYLADEREVIAGKPIIERVEKTLDPNGELRSLITTKLPLRDERGNIIGLVGVNRDVTEREMLERQILEISESEKRRIGQDLHDDLCQYLVGISLLANVLQESLARDTRKETTDARQIKELVHHAAVKARSIAKGLTPLSLAGDGFMNVLHELAETAKELFEIDCSLEFTEPVELDDIGAAPHLYRIAQEAVHNAAKHSQGRKIVLRLAKSETLLMLAIEDDGIGFSPGEGKTHGLGLHTMKYRARAIGASLAFERSELGGTKLLCTLPLCKQG